MKAEVTIDGSTPIIVTVKDADEQETRERAPQIAVRDAKDRGYDHVTEDLVEVTEVFNNDNRS